ncbi:hypothetical protein VPHD479_0232 [Vibrio phage D479]
MKVRICDEIIDLSHVIAFWTKDNGIHFATETAGNQFLHVPKGITAQDVFETVDKLDEGLVEVLPGTLVRVSMIACVYKTNGNDNQITFSFKRGSDLYHTSKENKRRIDFERICAAMTDSITNVDQVFEDLVKQRSEGLGSRLKALVTK